MSDSPKRFSEMSLAEKREYNRQAQAKWRAAHVDLARQRGREAAARLRAFARLGRQFRIADSQPTPAAEQPFSM